MVSFALLVLAVGIGLLLASAINRLGNWYDSL